MEKEISRATLKRLPTYLAYLKGMPESSGINISATALAAGLHMGEVQVRKDLALVSSGGRPKIGYNRAALIADIEQFFENLVVQRGFGIAVADVIAFDVHLNPAGVVLQFEKRGASHDPPRHDPSGNRNLLEISFVGIVLRSDPRGGCRHFVFGRRVRLYAQFTQFGQRVAPDLFLFAKFRDAHRVWIDCKSP